MMRLIILFQYSKIDRGIRKVIALYKSDPPFQIINKFDDMP